jgi:hypothetical protein
MERHGEGTSAHFYARRSESRRSHVKKKDPAGHGVAGLGGVLMNAPYRRRDENNIDSRARRRPNRAKENSRIHMALSATPLAERRGETST